MARIASRNFTKHCFLATWIFDIRNLDSTKEVLTGGLQVSEMLPSCDFMAADLVRAVLTLEGRVVVAPQLGCVVASDDDGGFSLTGAP